MESVSSNVVRLSERRAESKERLLTVKEAAHFLAVSPTWVYRAVAAKSIPVTRVGRSIRIVKGELLRWLDAKSVGA